MLNEEIRFVVNEIIKKGETVKIINITLSKISNLTNTYAFHKSKNFFINLFQELEKLISPIELILPLTHDKYLIIGTESELKNKIESIEVYFKKLNLNYGINFEINQINIYTFLNDIIDIEQNIKL